MPSDAAVLPAAVPVRLDVPPLRCYVLSWVTGKPRPFGWSWQQRWRPNMRPLMYLYVNMHLYA
jgi:hypothetical protein